MLAILTSHPIQYQVPLWRALAATDLPFRVWYLTDHGVNASHDREFGQSFAWDLDMLSGYPSVFLDVEPGWTLARFRGVRLREPLVARLRRENVRVLWIEGWRFQANWQALWAARAAGVEIWLRGDSNDLKQDSGVKGLIKRPVLRRFLNRVDKFLCVGSANRRLYKSYGVPGDKLHAAPHFVDNDWFRAKAESLAGQQEALREAWRIPQDAFCLLFCGKFITKKHPLDLVQAVHKLGAATPCGRPIHLLFVGSGRLGDDVRSACHVVFDAERERIDTTAAAGEPAASFVGFLNQTEIARAYVAADVLVLPSDSGETWGLVANEAMACGTPAVVSDQCGCAEDLVAPLDRRLVFRCGDASDLAEAIRHSRGAGLGRERVRQIADTHHLRHTVATVASLFERCIWD